MSERPITTTYPGDHDPARSEQLRRQELRNNFLVPIYVMWSSDVFPDEGRAALDGVKDALAASGQEREIVSFGSTPFDIGEFSSADWYVMEAIRRQQRKLNHGYGDQVDVEEVGNLFRNEPWQSKPHFEVMVVGSDLNAKVNGEYINFVFGSTDPFFPSSVQSVRRLREEVEDPNLRKEMIRRLLRHEVGHMFGLVGRNFRYEEKLGKHCTNVCSMRQGMSVREWASLVREENARRIHFCGDCQNELDQYKQIYKPLPK